MLRSQLCLVAPAVSLTAVMWIPDVQDDCSTIVVKRYEQPVLAIYLGRVDQYRRGKTPVDVVPPSAAERRDGGLVHDYAELQLDYVIHGGEYWPVLLEDEVSSYRVCVCHVYPTADIPTDDQFERELAMKLYRERFGQPSGSQENTGAD